MWCDDEIEVYHLLRYLLGVFGVPGVLPIFAANLNLIYLCPFINIVPWVPVTTASLRKWPSFNFIFVLQKLKWKNTWCFTETIMFLVISRIVIALRHFQYKNPVPTVKSIFSNVIGKQKLIIPTRSVWFKIILISEENYLKTACKVPLNHCVTITFYWVVPKSRV